MNEQGNKNTNPQDEINKINTNLISIKLCLGYLIISSEKNKEKNQTEKVEMLSNLLFDKESIAFILQTTTQTITTRLSEISKRKKGGK